MTRLPRAVRARVLVAALGALPLSEAHAGRPMLTDDTSTSPQGECQIEAWGLRVDVERMQTVAPACGLTDTLELDTQAARVQGGNAAVSGLGLGLKWAPAEGVYKTVLGELSLGLEGGIAWARDANQRWAAQGLGILALASMAIGSEWTVNANLGVVRNLRDQNQGVDFRVAVGWQASERWLLFVEALASDRARTLTNAGVRWWVVPAIFGLDLVTSREAGGGASVSLGFGWYGLRLP